MNEQKIKLTGLDIRIAIAIGICILTSKLFPYIQVLSACTAVILCTQDNAKIGWKNGITRLTITIVGGIMGILVVLLDNVIQNYYIFTLMAIVGILLTLLICKACKVPYIAARIGSVTFILVVIVASGTGRIDYAVLRLGGTLYGVVISLIIALIADWLIKSNVNKSSVAHN